MFLIGTDPFVKKIIAPIIKIDVGQQILYHLWGPIQNPLF